MPDIQCPVVGCDYSTGDVDNVDVAALLNAHTVGAHMSSQPVKERQPPKVERPQPSDAVLKCFQTRMDNVHACQ